MNFIKKNMKGFTLVELLIVIGILAVLAAVVIVAINPVQNLAKTRDAGRLSTIDQLGHALESSYTSSTNSRYVNPAVNCPTGGAAGTTWVSCLSTASGGTGEINNVPPLVPNTLTAVCAGPAGAQIGVQNGWCYKSGALGVGPVIAYSRLESNANISKCPTPASDFAYALYSSADGRSGVVCAANEAALVTGNQTFR